MDIYLFKPDEYQRLYNCSFYNIDDIPLGERQHIFFGILFIFFFFIFEFLYILCAVSIRQHLEHSCYKIMFYMGINDIFCLFNTHFFTGIFGIYGAVFCSFPNLIYICGVLGCVFWYNETICAIMLAINRCLEIALPSVAKRVFGGAKGWLWLAIPFLYGLLGGLPFKPVLYSGTLFSWFYNPHAGYADDFGGKIYNNPMVNVNNGIVVTVYPIAYLTFIIILICKSRSATGITNAIRVHKKIFIQVVLISSINATAAFIYVYMQFVHINEYIVYMGMFGWLFAHGLKAETSDLSVVE